MLMDKVRRCRRDAIGRFAIAHDGCWVARNDFHALLRVVFGEVRRAVLARNARHAADIVPDGTQVPHGILRRLLLVTLVRFRFGHADAAVFVTLYITNYVTIQFCTSAPQDQYVLLAQY